MAGGGRRRRPSRRHRYGLPGGWRPHRRRRPRRRRRRGGGSDENIPTALPRHAPNGDRLVGGEEPDRIWLSILGKVYDVTDGEDFYGALGGWGKSSSLGGTPVRANTPDGAERNWRNVKKQLPVDHDEGIDGRGGGGYHQHENYDHRGVDGVHLPLWGALPEFTNHVLGEGAVPF